MKLQEAAGRVLERLGKDGERVETHHPADRELLLAVTVSPRFAELKIGHYVEIFNAEKQEQFCAVTFLLPGGDMMVAYRGTDKTIIGWKEDFNMGFMDALPSQIDALEYLKELAVARTGRFFLCGHSKGGNLAMYAAAFADPAVQERIAAVRSLDGPGFKKQITSLPGFKNVVRKMSSFVPPNSVVGLILEHKEKCRVVNSFAKGSKQHDLYSWEIRRGEFAEGEAVAGSGQTTNRAINNWITKMSDESRRKLTDGIFEIIEAAQVGTLEELFEAKNLVTIMMNYGRLDDETKALLAETGRIFMDSLRKDKSGKKENGKKTNSKKGNGKKEGKPV